MPDTYPAARLVSGRVRAHFVRHAATPPPEEGASRAPVPDTDVIERIVNAAFWASLRREEGAVPKISLAYLPPEQDPDALLFEQPLALEPAALARVSPVVERAGIHLGVWHGGGALHVWGTTRTIPAMCFVLEVVEPGVIVVKHHSGVQAGKYVNVAVLEGDQVKIVDETASSLPDCPALLTSLLGFDTPLAWRDSINVLVPLAVSMRAHRRGGLLLVVPAGSEAWRESVLTPIAYAVAPPYTGLSTVMEARDRLPRHLWQVALRDAVETVAGTTAVDGATVVTDAYDLLGFGAKITRRRGAPHVEKVTVTEPIEGGAPQEFTAAQIGGTRHLSAAQFVHDQRDSLALVASQDGRFTVFAWSPCADQVHAHRVEALLL